MVSKYKETEIGSIPEEWDVTSLSDAFQNLEAGVSVNSDERQNADFFVLKTSAISDGLINIDEAKPVVKKEYKSEEYSSQKRIEVVDQFTDIAARITAFDPKAHIEYSVHNPWH